MIKFLKLLFLLIIAAFLSTPASSQSSRGVSDYDFRTDSNVRRGTRCLLKIEGDTVHNDYCDIYRQDGGRVTIVDTGGRKYRIVRDRYDNSSGQFQSASGRVIDSGITAAPGGCWRGESVRFCAR